MLLVTTMLALAAADTAPITGKWKNPSGSVIVAIDPCGAAYCGTVAWASDGAKADAAKAGTPSLVGTQLMTGFTPAGDGRWKGRLFVPDMKRRARAELRLVAGQLRVKGCALGGAVCKSQLWSRTD